MAGVLEGVKVGPLDPDAAERFGQTSVTARKLIRIHSRANPPELVRALSRKLDEPRTTAVLRHLPEVADYLAGLELENGDPVLPEGAKLEGAQVRGEPGVEQVLTYTYRVPSGRSAKWFVPYDGEGIPEAHEMGTELQRLARAREVGVVAWDDQGHAKEALSRENAGLRSEVRALRAHLEGRDSGEVPATLGDTLANGSQLEELEGLRVANRELAERLASVETALTNLAGGTSPEVPPASTQASVAEEPFDGYDDKNAEQVVAVIRADDTSEAELEAILAYERAHADRKTVVSAAERALDEARK